MSPRPTLMAVLRRRKPERQRPTVVLPDRPAPEARWVSHAEALIVAGRQLLDELWDERAPRAGGLAVPAPHSVVDLCTPLPASA